MPAVRSLLSRFIEGLPAPDVMPRTRARWEALAKAKETSQRAATHSEEIAANFPWAARSPARAFTLTGADVHLSLDDRWAIFGTIGSGKTTLARELVAALQKLYPMAATYILDSKGDGLFDRDAGVWDNADPPPVPIEPGHQIIWKPGDDDVDAYSAWFEAILKARAPAIVFVDELSSLARTQRSYAEGYSKLIKQGRSLHQCVITLSQEVAGIPRVTRNQVMHLVRMRLQDDYDAAKLDRLLAGNPRPRREPSRKFGLWYRRLDRIEAPREFSEWRELLA